MTQDDLKLPMRKQIFYCIVSFAVFLLFATTSLKAQPAVWQWSTLVKNAKDNNGQARAFLWIPPNCKKVKAFIFSQNNMEEQSILENPNFRNEMGKLGIAEVWISPSFDLFFRFDLGAGN